jgi:hypothetical protein
MFKVQCPSHQGSSFKSQVSSLKFQVSDLTLLGYEAQRLNVPRRFELTLEIPKLET